MNYDEMPAGESIDILVAEAIGWEQWQPCHGSKYPVATGTLHDEWEPSSNIAHAWEVVERIRPWIKVDGRGDGRGQWSATIWDGHSDGITAFAMTAPLAICRAALKARA